MSIYVNFSIITSITKSQLSELMPAGMYMNIMHLSILLTRNPTYYAIFYDSWKYVQTIICYFSQKMQKSLSSQIHFKRF